MLACKLCGGPATRSYRVERAYEAFDLLECDACGFHFIDHLDGPADWQALTVPLTTAEVAGCLECNTRRIEENAALLREHGSGRVLDVGCGAGGFLARIGSDHYATGLELDPRYVAVARNRGLNVIDCPLEATEWDGERFDTITLWDVIEHVNDPLKTARRVRGLLAPGGVLLMDTPNRDGPLYRFGQFTALLTRGRRLTTMSAQYSAFVGCHKQIFRKADMRTMLERAGFTDIQISIRSELSLPVARYLQCLGLSAGAVRLLTPIASAIIRILPVRNKMIVVAKRAIVRKKLDRHF
jgi:2-polyprenyl-3-methyl-5-hydroxy-6-metoxy-1,4-benzoquinol methylase